MTLREFIEEVNFHEHYRVYLPNRDCLIFESYFRIHSPYDLETDSTDLNKDYWDNNYYCDDVYVLREPDEQTKAFLNKYGDCEIFSLEIGGFKPCNLKKCKDGGVTVESVTDRMHPYSNYLNCFDVFITYPKIKE